MRSLFALLLSVSLLTASAQDNNTLLKEADLLEKQQKEPEAIDKYKLVLVTEPTKLKALVKLAELNDMMGNRQVEKPAKRLYYETALSFAKRAFMADSTTADANYVLAMASGKMTDVETDNKKIVAFVKDAKLYAERALMIDPNHARANYVLGKWHYEMVNLSGIKKVAVKLFYGGMPDGDMELAIKHMERCRTLEPYFAADYLDLGRAYKDDHKPTPAIEVLTRLVKLPNRTSEDITIKAEGAKLLETLQ